MQNLQTVLEKYRTIAIFVVLVAIVTIIFGAVYGTGQQILRGNANDPQVEVTKQVTNIINQQVPLEAIIGGAEQVDLNESESLFVILFDKDRKVVGSSVTLDGQTPTPPDGSFDAAANKDDYRFTWEPKPGVRVAAVLNKVDDQAYVLAARSLSETEQRIAMLTWFMVIGWVVTVILALLLTLLIKPRASIAIIEETNVTVVEEPTE